MDPIAAVFASAVVVTVLGSLAIVRRLHHPARPWRDVAQARFLLGIPWGSLIVISTVLCVYLFVQDGITNVTNPVTIPYRAWSYFAPLGMLTASFSHASLSHLVGNLLGTAVVAPLAEYAWGHYPTDHERGSADTWWTTPWVRALVIFPLVVYAVSLCTSLFALGPVIGFSGAVFAFVGFAIVHYPIVTLIGTLGVQGVFVTLFRALQNPISVYVAEASPPGPPGWATIAIQGHALGFFIGLVLGILVLQRRTTQPDPLRLWLAVLLFGFSKSLWAIYWFGGDGTFILFQAPGVVIVTVLSIVVTLAVTGSERSILPRGLEQSLARLNGQSSPLDRSLELAGGPENAAESEIRFDRIAEIAQPAYERDSVSVTQRESAFMAVLVVTAVLAGVAVPFNLFMVDGTTASAEAPVEVEGYTVRYAEDVENKLVSPVAVGPFADEITLESSGVIVSSDHHHIWLESVASQRLAFTGTETIYVGGPGWREAIHVERTGWEPVGNETVYQIWVREDGENRQLAYESNSSRADVRINSRNVTVASDSGEFVLEVTANESESPAIADIPTSNASTTAGGLTFERDGETVYAVSNGTRVAVALEETYK